jgi:Domain of unknown function (DU1801)
MKLSPAKTVAEYVKSLPKDQRDVINVVRQVIQDSMDSKLEEGMSYGMIGYYIPHSYYPAGYHCDPKVPLPYAMLAALKNGFSLYAMTIYGHKPTLDWFTEAWKKTGKKLDMGKSCIRFKKLDDLPLDLIADLFQRVSVDQYLSHVESALADRKSSSGKKKSPTSTSASSTKSASAKAASKKAVSKKAVSKKAKPS